VCHRPHSKGRWRKAPFSPQTIEVIDRLKGVYGLDFGAEFSHRLAAAELVPATAGRDGDE